MPRERVKLTDKEERILVQCQLMGMTTASMTKISNRLRALDQERDNIAAVNHAVAEYQWRPVSEEFRKPGYRDYEIVGPEGHVYLCSYGGKRDQNWMSETYVWDVKVTKPGTRFRPRYRKDFRVTYYDNYPKRILPDKNSALYALIKSLKGIDLND